MTTGKKILQFVGPGGTCTFTVPRQFVKMIPTEIVNRADVQYAKPSKLELNDIGYQPRLTDSFERKSIHLDKVLEETILPNKLPFGFSPGSPGIIHNVSDSALKNYAKHVLEEKTTDFMIQRLNHILMQTKLRPPVYKLDFDSLEDLSMEFANNYGRDGYIITFRLGPKQKFCAIADPSDFKFFRTEYVIEQQALDLNFHFIYRGELEKIRDDKWIVCQYQDDEYLKEFRNKPEVIK